MRGDNCEVDIEAHQSQKYGETAKRILDQRRSLSSILSTNTRSLDGKSRGFWRLTLILGALSLCLFMAALEATIVATAVPVIGHELQSAIGYTWIGGAYLLANCAAGPIWARLSDIWGRRPVLLSAITVFMTGSVVCASARTMPILIAGRAIQGSAGGALILLFYICISDLFSVRQRSLIVGFSEAVWACAGGIGPVLGGAFATLLSWRWCFWINLPLCGIAFVLVLLSLDIQHEHTSFKAGMRSFDWFGLLSFLGFTLMLLLGLNFGGVVFSWTSPEVIALLVFGMILAFVFVYCETCGARYPLVPLDLLNQTSNIASLLTTFFHGLVFMNSEYYLPLFFQSVLGVSPLLSGVLLLPYIISSAIAGILCGLVIHRVGRLRELIWVGALLLCIGNGLYLTWTTNASISLIVCIQLISGFGSGLLFEPPLIAIQSQVHQQDVATATSTFSFFRNIAISLCIVIGGAVFQNSMSYQSKLLIKAGVPKAVLDQVSGNDVAANIMIADNLTDPAQARMIRKAFTWSIHNMFVMFTVLSFCVLISGLLVKESHLAKEHVETVTGIKTESIRNSKR